MMKILRIERSLGRNIRFKLIRFLIMLKGARNKINRIRTRLKMSRELFRVRTPRILEKRIHEFVQDYPCPEKIKRAYENSAHILEEIHGNRQDGLNRDIIYHGTGLK